MSITVLLTIVSLCTIGVVSAIILYFVAQKFKVFEDPRIDQVEEILPGANCGGCGYPGCRGFAEATVKSETLEGLFCPVGGAETMSGVAKCLGKEVLAQTPKIAVLKCNGTCENRPKRNTYDGASSCAIQAGLYSGESACQYGCLGCGDCADACNFDALHMHSNGLPVVVQDKCVACGACVEACPKDLFELRNKGPKDRRVFVACSSKDKGGIAKKACSTACIGCMKCFKVCPFDAIVVENNLAYIDFNKCKLCRKCVAVCPTSAIHETNFPPIKPKPVIEDKDVSEQPIKTQEDTNKSDK